MWLVSLRDLQWRRRRVLIVLMAAALVFALTLLMAGLSSAFRNEADRTIAAVDVDAWAVADGAAGPFSATAPLPAAAVEEVADLRGVDATDPLVVLRQAVGDPLRDVNLLGVRPAGLGAPRVAEGRTLRTAGEAVVDRSLGASVGGDVTIGARRFTVVGLLHDATYYAGVPIVYVTVADAQALAFRGQELVTAVLVRGTPARAPDGLVLLDDEAARADLLRPLASATQAIDLVQVLLWLMAACIIGAIVYLSALERSRDFAVFKATGTASRQLLGGIALQAVIVSVTAALVATAIAALLAPMFPLPVDIPLRALLGLPLVAVVVGLVASLVGVRKAVQVDPASAFKGA